MSALFNRVLRPEALADLQTGLTAPVLAACRAAGLDLRIREHRLTAYHVGRAVVTVRWPPAGPTLEVHHKYVQAEDLPGSTRPQSGDYVTVPLTQGLADRFPTVLARWMANADRYVHHEERCEEQLLRDNAGGGPFVALDRQVGIPGTRSYVDVVGVLDGPQPSLVLVELKRDLDNRIQEVPAQVDRYVGFFSPGGKGLREDVARPLRQMAEQLEVLGVPVPKPASIEAGMPVLGLVVLVRYNPRSKLLGRAHELADRLTHPIWLWIAEKEDVLAVPPHDCWTRMRTVSGVA